MGTYYIPRNLKGETRILYIFTIRGLICTGIGAGLGMLCLYLPFQLMGIQLAGIVGTAILALIGFAVGTFKVPVIQQIPFTKKIGGEPLGEIIFRYIKHRMNRKVYIYTKEDK